MNRFAGPAPALVAASLLVLVSGAAGALAAERYPVEYFALREVVSNAQVSPDGRYLGLMKIASRDGDPIIEVYETADLGQEPFRVTADPMEITAFDWVSDSNFVMTLRQKVRDRIQGFNEGVYETRLAKVDVDRRRVDALKEVNPTVSHLLPDEPNKIILSFNPSSDIGSRLADRFRPRAYYKFDVERGTKQLILQGQAMVAQVEFDGQGHPWTARGFDLSKGDFLWYIRRPGESGWEEVWRQSEDSFETFRIEGFDEENRNILFVTAHNGNDKAGLWEFDASRKEFSSPVYRRADVEVIGVRMHSNPWTNPDTVAAVAYGKDKLRYEYFDPVEEATYRQLEDLVPYAWHLRITSRSRDADTLTVFNAGPRDPGTYYLLKDGRMQAIGSEQPLLKSEDLADVRYVTWESRDGREIPGYLTVPHGEPPFPAVVMPHGGPFVQEIVAYDEWGQLLANNGYLVLQPQYRGSRGYGLDFYTSAFRDGGQGGYRMQDDKDDGALWLVEQGLADRDRLALFGWSYGGYAALVAAARTPQIYQCVVAGAAVSDPIMQVNYYRDVMRGAQRDEQLRMWTDSVSPLKEVEKVNVPLLLVHGNVDQRVPPAHARKYRRELERHGKPYRFVELEGADHFYDTLFYEHQLTLYQSLIDYLQNDCGPDGL